MERIRARPWLTVAVVFGALLVLAWIGWAVYVASDRGFREGLGVLIAWPALLAAAALIALPFVAIYLIARRSNEQGAEDLQKSGEEEAELTEPG